MHKFVRNLLTEWRKIKLPFKDETIIIAVSGGADSVSLALALKDLFDRKKLKLRFVIAHFDHKLRGTESEKDAEFVKSLAESLGFDFELGISDLKFQISKKGNLEQNARVARYEFLSETAEKHKAYGILTAHTINDQAETFLLNMIRGSGMTGLSAMKSVITNYESQITNYKEEPEIYEEKSKIQNLKSKITMVRPLLNWAKREDTENFCREREIEFRRDEMNDDLNFKRVRVRKELIPLLKEFNPKIIETLVRTSTLLGSKLDSIFEGNTKKIKLNEDSLKLKELKSLAKLERYAILRNWIKENRGNLRQLELKHIESVERLIFSRKSGRIVELPNDEIILKKSGKLYFQKSKVEKSV
jgi:tRNA(Ile)-lysidine synthase